MTRACSQCQRDLPATREFFHAAGEVKCGLRRTCKDCDSRRHRDYRKKHPHKVKAWKAADHARHRDEHNEKSRQRYAANADTQRAKNAIYRETHREAARLRDLVYYQRNRDRVREMQNEYRSRMRAGTSAYCRQWQELDRARKAADNRKRRATEVSACGTHTVADVLAQFKRQRGRCYWCGVRVGKCYDVDHVIPLSRGGGNGPDNLVISCPRCNRSKSVKMPHEWTDRLC